jgi:hypothetical protein
MTIDVVKELKRVAMGVALSVPAVALYFIVSFFVDNGYVTPQAISYTIGAVSVLFMFWAAGGAFESYQEMKRIQTDEAFRKLGHRN